MQLHHSIAINRLTHDRYFFGIMLSVQERGQPVLGPSASGVLSIVLAVLCVVTVIFGIYGTLYDVILNFTVHSNSFASHWIKQMSLLWGETVDSGVIQFLFALYSPISRRDIYLQRKFVREEIKKGRALLEMKYPQPRNIFNRFRFYIENTKLTRSHISAEKKHVIPPQKLLANASRRESAFLMCMNKIVEFDTKICKTDDDRTGPHDPPVRFINTLKSSTQFMKDNIPADTIYFMCAFLIFKRKCCDAELLGEASRLYGSKLSRNFEDFSDLPCAQYHRIIR